MFSFNLLSFDSKQTVRIAQILGAELRFFSSNKKGAIVVALFGELGSGKTTFAKGFAKGLGVKERIISPTFLLMKRYPLKNSYFENLWHIDCYRIKSARELERVGFKKIISDPGNIVLIEWAEKLKKSLPRTQVKVFFEHVTPKERKITITA